MMGYVTMLGQLVNQSQNTLRKKEKERKKKRREKKKNKRGKEGGKKLDSLPLSNNKSNRLKDLNINKDEIM